MGNQIEKGHDKIIIVFFIILTIVITGTSVALGLILNERFYFLIIASLPFVYLIIKRHQKIKRFQLIRLLRKKWGVADFRNRNFLKISSYFNRTQVTEDKKYMLDDRTWNDLDMNLVYSKIDRTLTAPGEQILYSILRKPHIKSNELQKRNRLIKMFFQDQKLRERYQVAFMKLGKEGGDYLIDLLWGERPTANKYNFLYFLLICILPAFLVLGILNFSLAWIGLIAMLITNMVIHYRTKQRMYEHLTAIRYLKKIIKCATDLVEIKHPLLESYQKEAGHSISLVKPIARRTSLLGRETDNPFFEYMNIIFLIEVRAFQSIIKVIEKYYEQLRQIFTMIGFMDSMISVASFRAGLKYFVEPEFTKSGPFLRIEEAVHPLIENTIPNSISVESRGVIITGSNMSGKTTFLKTIGINAILTQTINTCLAKKYQSYFFNILTLIGSADNIIEGKSYYFDEIQALLRIINSSDSKITTLCLLDEIFRGTNSLERISASAEALLYLSRRNCVVFVTTHEHEITELVSKAYNNYHFSEEIRENEGISFSYKLRNGASISRNAINLLRYVGYPDEISNGAEMRVRKKIKNDK
jgi:DNA mismatch repair ATPase MutS